MTEIEGKAKLFYEIVAQDVQKGDPYSIRFKDDPVRYVGIPVLDLTAGEGDVFSFQILEPKEKKGLMNKTIDDIESMEKPCGLLKGNHSLSHYAFPEKMNQDIVLNLNNESVKFTHDGKASVIDAIKMVSSSGDVPAIWERLRSEHPDIVIYCEEYAFGDAASSLVVDGEGWNKIWTLLLHYLPEPDAV